MKSYRKAIAHVSEFIPEGRDFLDHEVQVMSELIAYIYQENILQVEEDILWAVEHPCRRLPRA
jgi:hypothetical protein